MGQQQLLLLVLGIVIVGIAVVAGIQAFSEGKSKSARDAAASDAMRIVSDAQAWKLKPQAFGGGAGKKVAPTFRDLGYPDAVTTTDTGGNSITGTGVQDADGKEYRTVSGCYTIDDGIAKTAANGGVASISISLLEEDGVSCGAKYATVDIKGTTSDDIIWSYDVAD